MGFVDDVLLVRLVSRFGTILKRLSLVLERSGGIAGGVLSLRFQRDGLPDCPDARREANPSPMPSNGQGAVTRDDVRDVTRAVEGLTRKLDDLRREYERRGRF